MYFSLSVESQAFGFLNKILNIGYIVTRNTVSINFHPSRVKKNEDLLKNADPVWKNWGLS